MQTPDVDAETARWWALTPKLLEWVQDLTPGASRKWVVDAGKAADPEEDDSRRLATIPARLAVPPPAPVELGWGCSVRVSLMAAWACTLVAVAGVGVLLRAAAALGSERRGAFASAVTHELRMPLTTFRLYSELLASGVVRDERSRAGVPADAGGGVGPAGADGGRKRAGVLEGEAGGAVRVETLPRPRAARVGMAGVVAAGGAGGDGDHVGGGGGGGRRGAGEDGRGGGAAGAGEPGGQRLQVREGAHRGEGEAGGGAWVEVRVSDAGPGLGGRAPFVAFSKRRDDPAPGIGLGLYLSRQPARGLGGELEHEGRAGGAVFVLRLPAGG